MTSLNAADLDAINTSLRLEADFAIERHLTNFRATDISNNVETNVLTAPRGRVSTISSSVDAAAVGNLHPQLTTRCNGVSLEAAHDGEKHEGKIINSILT